MQIDYMQIDQYIEFHWTEIVEDIASLVAISSVEDATTATQKTPWGLAVADALECALSIARRLGLSVHNCDGYLGYADLTGACERKFSGVAFGMAGVIDSEISTNKSVKKQIAVIAHLDVVPAGLGWDFDPFTLQRKNGYLVGRGVIDDKGPAVLLLWAAHFFVQQSLTLHNDLRILLGANEETGMADVCYYLSHYNAPDFLFTPDSSWPVVIGEKGSYNAEILFPLQKDGRIVGLEGGTVRNAVAVKSHAILRANLSELSTAPYITFCKLSDGLVRIDACGTGGHAAMPENTVSALGILVRYLLDNGLYNSSEKRWLEFQELIYGAWDGSLLGIDADDDIFSPLTIISGTMTVRDNALVQTIDCRYPKSTTPDIIHAQLQAICNRYGVTLQETHRSKYLFVDPDRPEITALLTSYEEWTGQEAVPVTIGGGTYAKHFPYAVAFGPEDETSDDQKPEWVGTIHGPNEAIREESLKRALGIYISALAKLLF